MVTGSVEDLAMALVSEDLALALGALEEGLEVASDMAEVSTILKISQTKPRRQTTQPSTTITMSHPLRTFLEEFQIMEKTLTLGMRREEEAMMMVTEMAAMTRVEVTMMEATTMGMEEALMMEEVTLTLETSAISWEITKTEGIRQLMVIIKVLNVKLLSSLNFYR